MIFLSKSTEASTHKSLSTNELSAAHRALEIPELRDSIIAQCTHSDFSNLRAVNHAFAASLNTPLIWRDEYAPAKILWPSRIIYTTLVPDSGSEPTADGDIRRPHKSCFLGTFRGDPWTLTTGLPPRRQDGDITDADLDKVAYLTDVAHGFEVMAAGPEDIEKRCRDGRDRAYTFLLDRAYRLKMGLPIATYRKEVPQLFGLVSIFVGLQYFVPPYLLACQQEGLHGWSQVVARVGRDACLGIYWLVSLVIGIGTLFWAGDDHTLLNIVMGPFQKQQLNAWARQVAEAQRIKDPETSDAPALEPSDGGSSS